MLCRWTPFNNPDTLSSTTGGVAPISWRKTSQSEAAALNGLEMRGDATIVDMDVSADVVIVDPMPKRKRPVRAQSTLVRMFLNVLIIYIYIFFVQMTK
jgi:hypothetical protein